MPDFIENLTSGWKNELQKCDKIKKIWAFFDIFMEEEGEIILQVNEEWEDFINVYQISISVTKLEFEENEKAFTPFLCVRKSAHNLEYKRYDKLVDMDDIISKLEDFVDSLPDIKVEEEKKEEKKEESESEEEEEEE